jgi:hypothetical protein
MKLLIAMVVLLSAVASAQLSGTGIGLVIGEPTGLSLKNWLSPNSALTFGAAWSFQHDGSLFLWGDYTLHSFDITNSGNQRSLAFYYGLGAKVSLVDTNDGEGSDDNGSDAVIGARIPLGLMLPLRSSPVDFFLEVVPTLDLSPDTEFGVNGGIGAHIFF